MPIKVERKLKKEAGTKELTGKRKGAYIFGTLRKLGWKPDAEK